MLAVIHHEPSEASMVGITCVLVRGVFTACLLASRGMNAGALLLGLFRPSRAVLGSCGHFAAVSSVELSYGSNSKPILLHKWILNSKVPLQTHRLGRCSSHTMLQLPGNFMQKSAPDVAEVQRLGCKV